MKLLLLTGIPGTGKTTVANFLVEQHDFRLLDFEDVPTLSRYWQFGTRGFRTQLKTLKQRGQDIVVDWGFVPSAHLDMVKFMRSLGFEWIWLDGDREAAHRAFTKRGTVGEQAWQIQLKAIAHIDLVALNPRVVDPFYSTGEFRAVEDVVSELLSGSH
jgi:adenylate kinase family enzyme